MQFSDILVKNALFCDETEITVLRQSRRRATLLSSAFRTLANNVDNVYLISRKK